MRLCRVPRGLDVARRALPREPELAGWRCLSRGLCGGRRDLGVGGRRGRALVRARGRAARLAGDGPDRAEVTSPRGDRPVLNERRRAHRRAVIHRAVPRRPLKAGGVDGRVGEGDGAATARGLVGTGRGQRAGGTRGGRLRRRVGLRHRLGLREHRTGAGLRRGHRPMVVGRVCGLSRHLQAVRGASEGDAPRRPQPLGGRRRARMDTKRV